MRRAPRLFRRLVLVAAAVMLCAPMAGAQQPKFEEAPGAGQLPEADQLPGVEEAPGAIITEDLEPLTPQGEVAVPRGERFKPAPFRTPEEPLVPERIPPVETVLKPGARLRQLDKMTGESETVELAAGEEARVDRLRVQLEACRAPQDNAEHGTMAFLRIWDSKEPGRTPLFSGWMFADSPALSAMDHPRYDLWVMSCTTASGDGPRASR